MKHIASTFIVAGLLCSQPLPAATCKAVTGVFQVWNGWPPSLRLADKKSGNIYGTYEHSPLPNGMRQEVIRHGHVTGKFCLKVVGHTKIPTQQKPITLVRVMSYSP